MKWGTVELVLLVEPTAAREWMTGPLAAGDGSRAAAHTAAEASATASAAHKRTARRRASVPAPLPARTDTATAIADALSRMPGITPIRASEGSTVRAFVESGNGWRVTLAATEDGARRATAVYVRELTPGVWRCETRCDEPLEAGAPLAVNDSLPQGLKDALGKPEKLVPSPALKAKIGVWRWEGPDGAVVDIHLHDARGAFECAEREAHAQKQHPTPTQAGATKAASSPEPGRTPIAFCELRLVAYIGPLALDTPTETEKERETQAASSQVTAEAGHTDRGHRSVADADVQAEAERVALRAVFAAAAALTDVLPVFPTLMDGYARVCLSAATDAPVRAQRIDLSNAKTPHGALIEAAASIARQCFGNEAGVREGADPEFVHQMRVAQRRLKTLLKTFPRWADDMWERTIAPDLDWLGGLLGQARDLDVFVDTTLPALAEADIDASAWAPWQARAALRRDEAREQVRAALRTRRYAALSLAWLRWLAAQRSSAGPATMAHKTLAGYARKRVRKHYGRLIAKPALTALTPAERHRRRIEAKRLRYTLEFFESLASHKTRRKVAKQLGRIQSVLGDGSDATAALHFLEALEVPAYEHGFARGWCEAVNRWSAIEGDRLLQELGKPKIVRAI